MLKIVTDGSVDMPDSWAEKYDIDVLPLHIRFGDRMYVQGENISKTSFYDLVREMKIIPKTSLPSPRQVIDFYQSILQKSCSHLKDEQNTIKDCVNILSIHLSAKLSGTYSTIQLAARELNERMQSGGYKYCVTPFDSYAGSAVLAFMCREARLMDQRGASLDEIITRLSAIRQRMTVIFTVDNLEFARLNGRIGAVQSAIGSLLNVKPIVVLKDGLLNMSEKVRTRHKAIDRVINLVQSQIANRRVDLAVVHANDLAMAEVILERTCKLLPVRDAFIADLSIPVAANLGPGTIGIAACEVDP